METIKTTRRDFVMGAAIGITCLAGMDATKAMADAQAETEYENVQADLPDTYSSATPYTFKHIITDEDEYQAALNFLTDCSHYLYEDRFTPFHGNYTKFPVTGFDSEWRSPLNGRPYRGPFNDPLSRSVIWLAANQNGSVNASVGSYWGVIPPNTELDLKYDEITGYEPSPNYTVMAYMFNGQTAQNFIRNGRGTLMIDAALAGEYGVTPGWGYAYDAMPNTYDDRGTLAVEVKLRSYSFRETTPEQFYDGYLPTTTNVFVVQDWKALPGWGADAGENCFRSIPQFWGCATGEDAELNLNSDEERAAYLERCNNDPAVLGVVAHRTVDLYFDIMQIVNVKQEVGFDFEQGSCKLNGIDMDHDGLLDRYPEGHEKAGEVILQNAYSTTSTLNPSWVLDLNYDLDWWVISPDLIINSEGKQLVGANPDGTYILAE